MTVLREGDLQIIIPDDLSYKKFDDNATHGLSHCMKAVDFIVELKERILFIEIKDPQCPSARSKKSAEFIKNFSSGIIDEDIKYKYRDSFLYEWAASCLDNKPITYLVLIAIDSLSEAELLQRTDALKRQLPVEGPQSGIWNRKIVDSCAVFNIKTWNRNLAQYPVNRISA